MRGGRSLARALMAAIALLGPPEASAQGPRAHYVNVTTFAHEFSSVLAVRELSDASILVGDRMEKQVIRLAEPSTPGRLLLRKGEGPGEVKDVARLFAALGDTTLVWDSVLRRAVVLVGARVVRTFPTSDGFWRGELEFPTAVDRDGNVYGLRAKASTVRKGPINPGPLSIDGADSAEVVVFPKGKPPARVLFTTRGAFTPAYMVLKTVDGMPIHYHLRALLDRPDLVAVCADGSMLHASSATGRAWWWRSGTSTALVTSLFARPPVTEARKRQAIVQSLDARLARFFSPDEYPP